MRGTTRCWPTCQKGHMESSLRLRSRPFGEAATLYYMSEAEQTSQSPPESEQESVRMIGFSEPSLSPEDSQLVEQVGKLYAEDKYAEAHQLLVGAGVADPAGVKAFALVQPKPPPASQ